MTAPPRFRNLTQELLQDIPGTHRALVTATEPGIAAGLGRLDQDLGETAAGRWRVLVEEGESIPSGGALVEIVGTAAELAAAEDRVLGPLGYAGGVARRCAELRRACPDGLRIACGGWKKLPAPLKPLLREGLAAGGVTPRLVDGDFVYVDKNVVGLLGGPKAAVHSAVLLDHGPVAVQVASVAEALDAACAGAGIVMVDTGELRMLADVHHALTEAGLRGDLVLAFAGGVTSGMLGDVRSAGAEVVDLGRAILDAPLWDLHLQILDFKEEHPQ
ncbi:nicotinate-nucleotide pyrophosphorylase (carboxylating) [Actinocorallia herbida]|uniref:Nicotinate-nucleotide pyrophosphorylase (Carboxylating) n=1 Tax=Actinocorallia herbida TaxID=58109 RepID=A0A3N1D4E9_9ACTN|nr:nicotinate-nucleotide pyrophosphorylase [Actinocorallia herbida]ROO87958.1 nicotinate-nucleotide pyrophosphorylase (carboxylating) [Actinocorallia herbida]